MAIRFQCEKCHQLLNAEDDMSGLEIACPKCGNKIMIGLSMAPDPVPVASPALPSSAPSPCTALPASETVAYTEISGLAVASMVTGILAMCGGWLWSGILLPVLALVFAHISLSKIRKHRPKLTGKGFAVTGLVLGYVSLIIAIIVAIAFSKLQPVLDQASKDLDQMNKVLEQINKDMSQMLKTLQPPRKK
jgi:DNA-directed RNA polymerase subunit RPC12/RpoP/MFS superfamily sulfate permease-like transporter